MFVVYEGPIDAVEVPALNVVAGRGEPVEVPDNDASRELLKQDCWKQVTVSKPDNKTTKKED